MATTGPIQARAGQAPLDLRLRSMWEAVARPDVKVVSTDVFDTVLWRQVPEPVHAFAIVGARLETQRMLGDGLSPAAFARLREEAEIRARELLSAEHGAHEVRLDEIYALLPRWVFRGEDPEAAMAVELAVERDLLVPDLDVVELLLAAADAGKRLVAVSDIYFTEAQLRGLLDQPVTRELPFERIFVSCEHRLGKSGGLFEIALRELGVAPEQVVHMGDNETADVEFPSKLGIACTPFERVPASLERVLAAERLQAVRHPVRGRESPAGHGAAGVVTDLTSLRGKLAAREEGAAMPPALRAFWEHGALVHGPVFTGFAEWVQERAAALGVSRVHGFMREGGFLGDLVDRAGEQLGTDVRAQPLWLNRAVLSVASLGEVTAAELRPLLVRRRTPTVERFLRTIGLAPADLPRFATHAATTLDDGVVRENLLAAIEGDEALRATILAHARRMRDRVVAYLLAELGGETRLVTLDLGWAGSAQGLLGRVLANAGVDIEVCGLYLALHQGAARRVLEGQRALGFLAEFGAPLGDTALLVRSPEVLEQICMPSFGSQVGLDENLQPVLEAGGGVGRVQAAEAEAVRDGIRAFQREWGRYGAAVPGKLGRLAGAEAVLRPLLLRSVVAPTAEEVATLGRWLHDENQGSDAVEAVLDPVVAAGLRHLDPAGLRDLPMSDLYWPFAVAAQVDPTWAALMDAASAGLIPWEALSGEADTGPFTVGIAAGAMFEPSDVVGDVPVRNRFGLSSVAGTLRGGAIHEVVIRPADRPALIRLDHLELRCFAQGQEEPTVLRLDAPAQFARLRRENCFVVNPNLFVVHSGGPALYLDLTADVAGHVSRVDVRVGFATMAIGEVLPTPGRIRNPEEAGVRLERLEQTLAELQSSLSWKVTKPLRGAKKGLGR